MSGESFERVRRPLGYAVHPNAIKRLLELWPDARVRVYFGRYDGRRTTHVEVRESDRPSANWVSGEAHCSKVDQFERRQGIRIAFRRALAHLGQGKVWPA